MSLSIIAPVSHQSKQELVVDLKAEMMRACKDAGDTVHDVLAYHFGNMGSCQRAILCYQTAQALGIEHKKSIQLAAIVELFHNASLIHDDIQDQDTTRRERLSLWFKYGSDIALCAGDSLILAGCQMASEASLDSTMPINSVAISAAQQTIKGQVADLSVHSGFNSVSYREMASDKAGPLIELALKLPCLYSGKTQILDVLLRSAKEFALAYQLYDDIIDLEIDMASQQPNAVSLYLFEHQKNHGENALELAKDAVLKEIYQLLDQADSRLSAVEGASPKPLFFCIQKLRQRLAGL